MPYDFIREFILLPQSPMLHFQHDCIGAALRASEVKPKLDRYLLSKKEGKVPDAWRNPKNPDALNYRLHFEAMEQNEPILVGKKDNYDIYYGNMGGNNANMVMGVRNKLLMTVTCFNKDLMEFIDSHLDAFFIVTNFGRMQNKGFGSFIVHENVNTGKHRSIFTQKDIALMLTEEYHAKHCFKFAFSQGSPDEKTLFKCIKTVYTLMKTGINFGKLSHPSLLFSYMKATQNFGNEKMWMISEGIAPIAEGSNYPKNINKPNNPRYLRALLGVGDHVDFMKVAGQPKLGKVKVKIKSSEIDRFPSPVFFKIVKNTVYFVGKKMNTDPNTKPYILGKEFRFSSSLLPKHPDPKSKGLVLTTPETLPEDFMDEFMQYCCNMLTVNVLKQFSKFTGLSESNNLTIKEV